MIQLVDDVVQLQRLEQEISTANFVLNSFVEWFDEELGKAQRKTREEKPALVRQLAKISFHNCVWLILRLKTSRVREID